MQRLTPNRAQADNERRIANVVRLGVIDDADYTTRRVRVRMGDLLSGWLPFATPRAGQDKTWHPVEVGEQVVLVAPNGDLTQAIVLASLNSNANPGPADKPTLSRVVYEDGTFVQHDREISAYTIDVNPAGRVLFKIGGSAMEMTDEAILIASNGSTIRLDAAGIRLNAPRIDLKDGDFWRG